MELNRYEKFLLENDVYWFVSTGRRGDIYKGVWFQKLPEENRYNLALGDIDGKTGLVEFHELSGNGDARMVFATIADIVDEYTATHPDREIFVSGNSPDKKRSYSLMIARYLGEIRLEFDLWGANVGEAFREFEPDEMYDAILLKRK